MASDQSSVRFPWVALALSFLSSGVGHIYCGRRYRVLIADDSFDDSATEEIDVTVPDRSVFVIGDNRDRSKDSRHIGSIHVGDVIGYVDYIYFPAETWSRFGACRD